MPVVSMDFLTHRSHRMDFDSVLTRISLCAPTAQITSGGGEDPPIVVVGDRGSHCPASAGNGRTAFRR